MLENLHTHSSNLFLWPCISNSFHVEINSKSFGRYLASNVNENLSMVSKFYYANIQNYCWKYHNTILGISYYFLTDTICLTVSVLSSVYSLSLFSRDSVASLESFSFSTRCFDSSFNCCSTSSRRCTVDCLSLTSLKYKRFRILKFQQNEFYSFYSLH